MAEEQTREFVGKVCGCDFFVTTAADGKKHFESECLDKAARDELSVIFEQEAILRITPKAFLEEIPGLVKPEPAAPVTES